MVFVRYSGIPLPLEGKLIRLFSPKAAILLKWCVLVLIAINVLPMSSIASFARPLTCDTHF